MINYFIKVLFQLPENPFRKILRDLYYGDVISERLIEYPFVFQNLNIKIGKILDIGCYYSCLPIQLASLGYRVWGLDVQKYLLTHPNFKFVRSDILNNHFLNNFFDIVTMVSTLEHIGLGFYKDPVDLNSDIKAINEVYRVLKKGGRFILTTPISKRYKINGSQKFYDLKRLSSILGSRFMIEIIFFQNIHGSWMPITKTRIPVVKGNITKVVAMIVAEKL